MDGYRIKHHASYIRRTPLPYVPPLILWRLVQSFIKLFCLKIKKRSTDQGNRTCIFNAKGRTRPHNPARAGMLDRLLLDPHLITRSQANKINEVMHLLVQAMDVMSLKLTSQPPSFTLGIKAKTSWIIRIEKTKLEASRITMMSHSTKGDAIAFTISVTKKKKKIGCSMQSHISFSKHVFQIFFRSLFFVELLLWYLFYIILFY